MKKRKIIIVSLFASLAITGMFYSYEKTGELWIAFIIYILFRLLLTIL